MPETETPSPQPTRARLTLERLEIRNFKNIEHLEIDFSARSSLQGNWTCIAGINGSGKTSILQAICLVLLGRRRAAELGTQRLCQMMRRNGRERCGAEIRATLLEGAQRHTLYLPLGEEGIDEEKLRRQPDADAIDELWKRLGNQMLMSYGATRNLSVYSDTRYANVSIEVRRQITLFDPLTQIATFRILTGLAGSIGWHHPVPDTIKALLDTVLADNELGLTVGVSHDRKLLFQAAGSELEAIDLPDGFRALVAWLGDLCAVWHYMIKDRSDVTATSPADMTGIVLLDEIDLHLHPALQRSLVPRLRRALPNIQWIVTTHSPLILSSFDKAELVLLDRDSEGGLRQIDRQILGFSSDQVYRWLMGTSPHSSVIEEKLEKGEGEDDVAVLLYQSEDRDEPEAERALALRRERLARLKQRNERT